MASKRGEFTARVKIRIDDSQLQKDSQEMLKKLGKMTDSFGLPVNLDYKNGYLDIFKDFKKDMQGMSFDNFDTAAVSTAIEKLGISTIDTLADLQTLENFFNRFFNELKSGNKINTESLIGDTARNAIQYYDELIAKQEKFIEKQEKAKNSFKDLEKIAAKRYKEAHQSYLAAVKTGDKSKIDAASRDLVAAGNYYAVQGKRKYGSRALETFEYDLHDKTYDPIVDYKKAKKALGLTKEEILELTHAVHNEISAAFDSTKKTIADAKLDLDNLKKKKEEIAKIAIVDTSSTYDKEIEQIKKETQVRQSLNEAKKEEKIIESSAVKKDSAATSKSQIAAQEVLNQLKKEEQQIEQNEKVVENISTVKDISEIEDKTEYLKELISYYKEYKEIANAGDASLFDIENTDEYEERYLNQEGYIIPSKIKGRVTTLQKQLQNNNWEPNDKINQKAKELAQIAVAIGGYGSDFNSAAFEEAFDGMDIAFDVVKDILDKADAAYDANESMHRLSYEIVDEAVKLSGKEYSKEEVSEIVNKLDNQYLKGNADINTIQTFLEDALGVKLFGQIVKPEVSVEADTTSVIKEAEKIEQTIESEISPEVSADIDETSVSEASQKIEETIEKQSIPEIPVKIDDAVVKEETKELKKEIENAVKPDAEKTISKTDEELKRENIQKGIQAQYARINKLFDDYYSELNAGGDSSKLKGIEAEIADILKVKTSASDRKVKELLKKNLGSGKDATLQAVDKKFGTDLVEKISKIQPIVEPKIDEATVSVVSEKIEAKIETEVKPEVPVKVDQVALQKEVKAAVDNVDKQVNKTTSSTQGGAKKSIWEGFDNKTKALITYIQKERKTKYSKQSEEQLFTQIATLLKGSVDSKTPLNDTQLADLVAMVESYKKISGKKSPNSYILKKLGIEDFDDVYDGKYGKLKDDYENVIRKAVVAQKQKETSGLSQSMSQEVSSIKEVKKELQETKAVADATAASIENVKNATQGKTAAESNLITVPLKSQYEKLKADGMSVSDAKVYLSTLFKDKSLIDLDNDVDYNKVSTEAGHISTTLKSVREKIKELNQYSKSDSVDENKLNELIETVRQYIYFCYDSDRMLTEAQNKLDPKIYDKVNKDLYYSSSDKINVKQKDASVSSQKEIQETTQSVKELSSSLETTQNKTEAASNNIKEEMSAVQQKVENANISVKELNNSLDTAATLSNDTSESVTKKSHLVMKQQFEQAAKNTDGFIYEEGSLSISSKGIVTLKGQIKDLDGNLVQASFKFEQFDEAVKDGVLNLDYLKEKIQQVFSTKGSTLKDESVKNTYSLSEKELIRKESKYDKVAKKISSSKLMNDFLVNVNGKTTTLSGYIEDLNVKIKQVQAELRGEFESKGDLARKVKEYDDLVNTLNDVAKNPIYQQFVKGKGDVLGVLTGGADQIDTENRLNQLLEARFKKIKSFSYDPSLHKATASVLDDGKIKKVVLSLEEYQNELKETSTQVRMLSDAGKEELTFGQKWKAGLKSKIGNLSQYVTGIELVMRAWNEVKEGFQFVKELDSLMTTVYQTMDITREGLHELSVGAIETAKALGTTTDQVTQAIGIYAAYGETVDSILNKASPTVMLANASGASVEAASDQIQAVLQQYKELEGQERRIVNSYEKIAANVQIDFDKGINSISEGVQTAGSVMNEAGVDFETYAASLAKVAEKTRLEGSQIGNAMKTIASRISRSKSGDDDVTDEDRSNASKAYASVGIGVYNDDGSYRGLATILDELADKWDTLTDAQKNYIAEQSAGIRNINIFNTMLDTWDEAKDLASDAMSDTDYIDEVQDKYMESIQAHLNALRSSTQEFWYTLLDSEIINVGIDILTGMVKIMNGILGVASKIGGVFSTWGSSLAAVITLAATAWGSFKAFEKVKDLMQFKTKKDLLQELVNIKKQDAEASIKQAAAEGAATAVEKEAIKTSAEYAGAEGVEATSKNVDTQATRANTAEELKNIAVEKLAKSESSAKNIQINANAVSKLANGKKLKLAKGVSKTGAITTKSVGIIDKIKSGFAALAKTLHMSTAALGTLLGAIAALGVGIAIFDKFTDSTEETKEKIKELNKTYEESQSKLKDQKNLVDSVGKEFEELSKGVDSATGTNLDLSTEEFERYQEICNQIADTYPDLVKGYDAQGNAILNLKGNVEELTAAYEAERLAAARTALGDYNANTGSYENLDTYLENFGNITGNRSIGTKAWDIFSSDLFGYAEIGGRTTSGEIIDALKEIQGMTYEEVQDWIEKNKNSDVYSWLSNPENLGLTADTTGSYTDYNGNEMEYFIQGTTEKEWIEAQKKIVSLIGEIGAEVNDAANNLKIGMQQYLTTLELGGEFDHLDDTVFQQVSQMIANAPRESLKSFEGNQELLKSYVRNWVETLSNDAYKLRLDSILSLDDDSSIEAMAKVINEDLATLAKGLGIGKGTEEFDGLVEQLGLTEVKELVDGFEGDIDDINKTLNKTNKATDKQVDYHKDIKKFIKDEKINTKDELNLLKRCVKETDSWADAIDKFAYESINLEVNASKLDELEANLENVQETINNIGDAYSASASSKGLNREQIDNIVAAFEDLEGYDYDKLFESTAEGVHLNVLELDRLNDLYDDNQRKKYADQLIDLQEQYAIVCDRINDESDALERNRLIAERNGLAKQIDQCRELASMYEGLTNAVTRWQEAASGGEEDDIYNSIVSGFEEMDELYQKDKTGTNYFKTFMQMFSYEDLDEYLKEQGIGYQEYYEQRIGEIQKYFKDDVTGVQNFLYKLQELGFAGTNTDGTWWIKGSMEEMAKALNWSEAALDSMFKNFSTYEFGINFTEESEDLKGFRIAAEEANKSLKELTGIGLGADELVGADTKEEVDAVRKKLEEWKKQFAGNEEALKAINAMLDYTDMKLGEIAGTEFLVDIDTADGILSLQTSIAKLNEMSSVQLDIDFANKDPEYWKNQLETFQTRLEELQNDDGKIPVEVEGYNEALQIFTAIQTAKARAEDKVILSIDTTKLDEDQAAIVSELQEIKTLADELSSMEAAVNAGFEVDTTEAEKRLYEAVDVFQQNHPTISTGLKIDAKQLTLDENDLAGTVDKIQTKLNEITPTMTVQAGIDATAVKNYDPNAEGNKEINFDPNMTAVNTALSDLDLNLQRKRAILFEEFGIETIESQINKLNGKTITINVKQNGGVNVGGGGVVNGTAHSTGTAYAGGNWGAEKTETALVGELGEELRVNAKTGRWELLGHNGAEFADINKGDIIFNHKQTEELFKNGRVTSNGGRGKAFLDGTVNKLNSLFRVNGKTSGRAYAHVIGTVNDGGKVDTEKLMKDKDGYIGIQNMYVTDFYAMSTKNTDASWKDRQVADTKKVVAGVYSTNGSVPGGGNTNLTPTANDSLMFDGSGKFPGGNGDPAEEFEETIDWIEVLIDRLERRIETADLIANSAFKKFTTRNEKLKEEMKLVEEELGVQEKAIEIYKKEAEAIGLSQEYMTKVQEGKLEIEDITDEELHEKIQEYQELWEKMLDCNQSVEELKEKLGELARAEFDLVIEEFDLLLAEIEDSTSMLEGALDIVEARGYLASKAYYENLMKVEQDHIKMLENEYATLQDAFETAMSYGYIEEESAAWYEMQAEIRGVEQALQDANLSLIEFQNNMRENDWSIFERMHDYISQITDESEFLIDLLSFNENNLFDEKSGLLTDTGGSVGGLHAMNYNVYMAQAEEYEKKVKEINAELAKDPYNTILIDKKNEYIAAQRESIQAANDEKMAVKDLIEESYNRMLDILQEMIDKRKELLSAERDLYEYEQNVAEQTENIANLQKQLQSLSGDDSEESRSKRQSLQKQLEDAEKELEQTEYDRWLQDQEKLMDDMYLQWEGILNERLDNIDGLLSEMITATNENSVIINETITSATEAVGYNITEGMRGIWEPSMGEMKEIVTLFDTNFTTTLTTTNSYIQSIRDLVAKIVDQSTSSSVEKVAGTVSRPNGSSSSSSGNRDNYSGSGGPIINKTDETPNKTVTADDDDDGIQFITKKDYYPKTQLNTAQSVVDQLKYYDIDSSLSARESYYKQAGGTGTYQNTYDQNVWLLQKVKEELKKQEYTYATGGQIADIINASGEDGFLLARKGEYILTESQFELASSMIDKLIDFSKLQPNTNAIKGMSYANNSTNNIEMNITLPNVDNYDSFVKELQRDPKFEKIVQSMTIGKATGKSLGNNSLNKFKYK